MERKKVIASDDNQREDPINPPFYAIKSKVTSRSTIDFQLCA